MFLINNEDYDDVISKKRLFMASFYQKMRRKFNILIDTEGKPIEENGHLMKRIERNY